MLRTVAHTLTKRNGLSGVMPGLVQSAAGVHTDLKIEYSRFEQHQRRGVGV
jgi:hypothetical protein